MKRTRIILLALCLVSSVLLSLPWLVPGTGALSLVAFVPLLFADAIARECRIRGFWLYYVLTFIVWNAATTFWVCNATVGGGIFAIVANALQMSLIWMVFRLSTRLFKGVVPYVFLAAMWIAWERRYFDVDISWPWLVLGNAFAGSTRTVQWYEFTGTLGGSLWVWLVNLSVFGLLVSLSDGLWRRWNNVARACSMIGIMVLVAGPVVLSKYMYDSYGERSEESVAVVVAQPNFDPYEKFQSMSQAEQTAVLLDLFDKELQKDSALHRPVLLLAPETFTSDVTVGNVQTSPTMRSIYAFLQKYPHAEMLLGAGTYRFYDSAEAPDIRARKISGGWVVSHNSAILADPQGDAQFYHKSKLVVGTELTPYPKIFVPIDDWLSEKLKVSSLMGRCVGQDEVSLLDFRGRTPLGCAICYESVYGEYCTEYVRRGARAMTVITNDAWWGDSPGYRQHLSYSCLRAIELRRDIARCGNTGISCFIDQRGEILESTPWWTRTVLRGELNLNSEQTFFVRHGDIAGRVSTLVFLLLAALMIVRAFLPRR